MATETQGGDPKRKETKEPKENDFTLPAEQSLKRRKGSILQQISQNLSKVGEENTTASEKERLAAGFGAVKKDIDSELQTSSEISASSASRLPTDLLQASKSFASSVSPSSSSTSDHSSHTTDHSSHTTDSSSFTTESPSPLADLLSTVSVEQLRNQARQRHREMQEEGSNTDWNDNDPLWNKRRYIETHLAYSHLSLLRQISILIGDDPSSWRAGDDDFDDGTTFPPPLQAHDLMEAFDHPPWKSQHYQREQLRQLRWQQEQQRSLQAARASHLDQWYYMDPDQSVHGPFSSNQMHDWYRSSLFSRNILVKASQDAAWIRLGSLISQVGSESEPFLTARMTYPSAPVSTAQRDQQELLCVQDHHHYQEPHPPHDPSPRQTAPAHQHHHSNHPSQEPHSQDQELRWSQGMSRHNPRHQQEGHIEKENRDYEPRLEDGSPYFHYQTPPSYNKRDSGLQR